MLSDTDLQKAEEFIRTMKPLYRSSLCVSADKSPTCSQIFPILKKLEAHFETQDEDSLFTDLQLVFNNIGSEKNPSWISSPPPKLWWYN